MLDATHTHDADAPLIGGDRSPRYSVGRRVVVYWLALFTTWFCVIATPIVMPHPVAFLVGPITVGILAPCVLWLRRAGASNGTAPAREDTISDIPAPRPQSNLRARTKIHVVNVERLGAALATRPPTDVLVELASSSRTGRPCSLLDELSAASSSFALVSYRQETVDGVTIDAEALCSIAATAAATPGLHGLWLDSWCYVDPGPYNHDRFCKVLHAVTSHAALVLWLARARSQSAEPHGSYQFRLWPTFEAAVVAQRRLPVRPVGIGPSPSQHLLRILGSAYVLLPGLVTPTEIYQLALFNTALSITLLVAPWMLPLALIFFRDPRMLAQLSPALGRQARLARSGASVLRVMHHHQIDATPSSYSKIELLHDRTNFSRHRDLTLHPSNPDALDAELRRSLPWLPAYDRRDSLAVLSALDVLDGLETADATVAALGVSIYAAAKLLPSEGDEVAGRSLTEWSPHVPTGMLPMRNLREFGWTIQRGSSCILCCPHGFLHHATPPTHQGVWNLAEMQPVGASNAEAGASVTALVVWLWLWIGGAICLWISILVYGFADGLATGVLALSSTWAIGLSVSILGAIYRPMIKFSWLRRAPAHHMDLAFLVQPDGYSIFGLWLYAACGLFIFGCFFPFLGLVAWVEQWRVCWHRPGADWECAPRYDFPLGRFDASAVPPQRMPLVFSLVSFVACNIGLFSAAGVSQAMHQWDRAAFAAVPNNPDVDHLCM